MLDMKCGMLVVGMVGCDSTEDIAEDAYNDAKDKVEDTAEPAEEPKDEVVEPELAEGKERANKEALASDLESTIVKC